jgi:hypothetical protein
VARGPEPTLLQPFTVVQRLLTGFSMFQMCNTSASNETGCGGLTIDAKKRTVPVLLP